eukprot:10071942-Ditylum_brightwellii.AAC.1
MGSSSTPMAFTVGIDATIVVKSWQLLQSHGAIVGGVQLNHFLDVTGKSDKENVDLMKECIAEKYGDQAAELGMHKQSMRAMNLGNRLLKLVKRQPAV